MRRLRSRNKFVDLGHGIGKAVLAAVFVADFKEYHGVEILQGRESVVFLLSYAAAFKCFFLLCKSRNAALYSIILCGNFSLLRFSS